MMVRIAALAFLSSLVVAVPLGGMLAWIAATSTGVDHPLWTLAAWLSLSVVLHEVGHGLALAIAGHRPSAIRIGPLGLSLHVPADLPPRTLILSAVAGPLAALIGCLAIGFAVGLGNDAPVDRAALAVLGVGHAVTLLMPVGDGKVVVQAMSLSAAHRRATAGPVGTSRASQPTRP